MPSLRLFVLQTFLDNMSTDPATLEGLQRAFEDELLLAVATDFKPKGVVVKTGDIEVIWFIAQRTRNAPNIGLEILFSEFEINEDPGYKTTPAQKKHLRDGLALAMLTSKVLQKGITIGVWVSGRKGATYTELQRT